MVGNAPTLSDSRIHVEKALLYSAVKYSMMGMKPDYTLCGHARSRRDQWRTSARRGGFHVRRNGKYEVGIVGLPVLDGDVENGTAALLADDVAGCLDVGQHFGAIR